MTILGGKKPKNINKAVFTSNSVRRVKKEVANENETKKIKLNGTKSTDF